MRTSCLHDAFAGLLLDAVGRAGGGQEKRNALPLAPDVDPQVAAVLGQVHAHDALGRPIADAEQPLQPRLCHCRPEKCGSPARCLPASVGHRPGEESCRRGEPGSTFPANVGSGSFFSAAAALHKARPMKAESKLLIVLFTCKSHAAQIGRFLGKNFDACTSIQLYMGSVPDASALIIA